MITRRDKVAGTLLKPINPSIIIVLGIYTVVWGLWLISPFWTVFTQASLYSAMMSVGPESFWGIIAIASGLLVCRGATKPSYINLNIGSLTGFFYWLVISILYFAGDWMNTGGITSLTFAIYSGIVFLNIKVNKDHFREYNSRDFAS